MRRIIHAFSRPMSSSSHPSLSLFIAQWGRGFVPNFNFLHLISGMAGPVPGPRVTHIFPIEMFRDEMMRNIICISRDNCYNDVTMRSSWECWERLASEHLASHVPDAVSEGEIDILLNLADRGPGSLLIKPNVDVSSRIACHCTFCYSYQLHFTYSPKKLSHESTKIKKNKFIDWRCLA